LNIFGSDTEFLPNIDPSVWANDEKYASMKIQVTSIKVTNDVAERAISLMTDYN
jgi:hypothetical protein